MGKFPPIETLIKEALASKSDIELFSVCENETKLTIRAVTEILTIIFFIFLSGYILHFIIFLIFAGNYSFPPAFILQIPIYCICDRVFKSVRWCPSQFIFNFR